MREWRAAWIKIEDKVLPVPVCTHDQVVYAIFPQFALCVSEYVWNEWTIHYFQWKVVLSSRMIIPLSCSQPWRWLVSRTASAHETCPAITSNAYFDFRCIFFPCSYSKTLDRLPFPIFFKTNLEVLFLTNLAFYHFQLTFLPSPKGPVTFLLFGVLFFSNIPAPVWIFVLLLIVFSASVTPALEKCSMHGT